MEQRFRSSSVISMFSDKLSPEKGLFLHLILGLRCLVSLQQGSAVRHLQGFLLSAVASIHLSLSVDLKQMERTLNLHLLAVENKRYCSEAHQPLAL